ncbi:hypothetical protein Q9L58_006797 [Maublancomyces gigas]|uniref:Uncharacterized protein n=1 Tax=Discina gigas TaxID=1032678 RepID=A0ABR3GEB7_9PEZI
MGKDSNLDNTPIYEASDHHKTSRKDEHRYDEGTKNSHKATDSKDQRSIANRLGAAELLNRSHRDDTSGHWSMPDPRAPALMHGNEPSKGAKIDAELQAEDEATMAKKTGHSKTDSLPGKK